MNYIMKLLVIASLGFLGILFIAENKNSESSLMVPPHTITQPLRVNSLHLLDSGFSIIKDYNSDDVNIQLWTKNESALNVDANRVRFSDVLNLPIFANFPEMGQPGDVVIIKNQGIFYLNENYKWTKG